MVSSVPSIKKVFTLLKGRPTDKRTMEQTDTVVLSAECILRNGGAKRVQKMLPAGTKLIVKHALSEVSRTRGAATWQREK